MQHRFLAASFTLIVGCGMKEEKFEEKYAEAYCEWLDGCAILSEKHGTMDVCVKAQNIFADESLTPDDCEYDKKQAKECIKAIEDNEDCEIEGSIPDVCLEVSSCSVSDTGE